MPTIRATELQRSHKTFYCINGHPQFWPGKSDLEKLKDDLAEKARQLEFEKQRAATNFQLREKAEAEVKKIRKRVGRGACPCCKRSFTNLQRHMTTKHPDFAEAKS